MRRLFGVAALLCVAGLGERESESATAAYATLSSADEVLSAPANLRVPCTGYCEVCLADPGHAAGTGGSLCEDGTCTGQNASRGDGWHATSCEPYDDCSGHQCQATFAEAESRLLTPNDLLTRVSLAVSNDDEVELLNLLNQNPERLRYVEMRNAIQMMACDGEVRAHYPLASAHLSMLLD